MGYGHRAGRNLRPPGPISTYLASNGAAMTFLSNPRFLTVYSGVLTVAFVVTAFCGASMVRNQAFGTITVRRINVVEPDGTVRLIISNRADFPGSWRHKKEYPRPDRREAAGMLFMSEEGTELGGLIWGAHQNPDGTIESHGHLSMDQYEENQIFAIDAGQEGKDKFSRITIADQGDYPIKEKRRAHEEIEKLPANQQDAAWRKFFASHRHDVNRLVLGRFADRSVGLNLRDETGKVRIVLAVQPDGKPVLQFLDDSGEVVREFSSTKQ
jgi:hypothetical protein